MRQWATGNCIIHLEMPLGGKNCSSYSKPYKYQSSILPKEYKSGFYSLIECHFRRQQENTCFWKITLVEGDKRFLWEIPHYCKALCSIEALYIAIYIKIVWWCRQTYTSNLYEHKNQNFNIKPLVNMDFKIWNQLVTRRRFK